MKPSLLLLDETTQWSTTVTLSNCYHACANVHQLACTRGTYYEPH